MSYVNEFILGITKAQMDTVLGKFGYSVQQLRTTGRIVLTIDLVAVFCARRYSIVDMDRSGANILPLIETQHYDTEEIPAAHSRACSWREELDGLTREQNETARQQLFRERFLVL